MKSMSTWNPEAARSSRVAPLRPVTYTAARRTTPTWLQQLVQWLSGNTDPRISLVTRNGQPLWKVFDPASGYTAYFQTEAEVRHWLDQRYYSK